MLVTSAYHMKRSAEIFRRMDDSGEGLLSKEELKANYSKYFSDVLTDHEFNEIIKVIDQDNSGQISCEEFLRATINYENIVSDKNLKMAFEYFDKDHSGALSKDEIMEVLGIDPNNKEGLKVLDNIFKEIDLNNDGEIDLEEFKTMMRNENVYEEIKKN